MMFKNQKVDSLSFWNAIDIIAARNNMSLMRVATKAGLDPTSLSYSKRVLANGKARWMSTSTLTKVLQAMNVSLSEFVTVIEQSDSTSYLQAIRVIATHKKIPLSQVERLSGLAPKSLVSENKVFGNNLGNNIEPKLSSSTLTKILQILNVTLSEFVAVVEENDRNNLKNVLPLYTWNRILQCSSLLDIKPPLQSLQLLESNSLQIDNRIAINGPVISPWQPIYCTNRFLIISIFESIEANDLVLIRMQSKQLYLGTFLRRTTIRIRIQHNHDKYDPLELDNREISWMAKVSGILMEPIVRIK